MKNIITKIKLTCIAGLLCMAAKTKAQVPLPTCVNTNNPIYIVQQDSNFRTQTQPASCSNLSGYINTTAGVTFNVNFHFFRPTVGNTKIYNKYLDFYKNVTAADCDTMVKILNERMANLKMPDLPTNPPASPNYVDSRIRFNLPRDIVYVHGVPLVIPHVYVHTNDTAWKAGFGRTSYLYNRYKVNPATEINIFFTADTTQLGTGVAFTGYIMICGIEWHSDKWRSTSKLDLQMVLHELGHFPGLLAHTDIANGFPITNTTDYYVEQDCGCPSGPNATCTPIPNPCLTWGNVNSISQTGSASNNIMGYNNDRQYLSPNQIGSYSYGAVNGITSSYSNLCTAYDSTKSIIINTDTIWDRAITTNGDIIVKAGHVLTIQCVVNFGSQGRLIIEPTAKLILDGGTLTTACGGYWGGVQVWGDNIHGQQISHSRPTYQGMIQIINGGTIKNAQVGINTIAVYNNGNMNWNKTGGIIQATGANFNGNIKDVAFYYYQAAASSSFFYNCSFNQNGLPAGAWADARVSLYGINGVKFYGNTFTALAGQYPGTPNFSLINNGITSADASYALDDYNGKRTSFTHFLYGIYAQNTAIFNPVNINHGIFSTNFTGGIYLNQAHYSIFTNDSINVNGAWGTNSVPAYGIYLDNCHGYSVRGNKLTGNLSNGYVHTGIIVNNSGAGANSIYNNTFKNLQYGLWAQEQNQGNAGANGLVMNCNDFTNCNYDIGVVGNSIATAGVAKIQGLHNTPAQYVRNTYSVPSCSTENKYKINNVGYPLTHASFVGATYQPIPQTAATLCSDSSKIKVLQDAGTYNKTTYCPANCTGCRTIPQVHQNLGKHKEQLINLSALAEDAAGSIANQKQTLQDQVIYEQNELGNLANEKIRGFLNDTTLANPMDSVIAVLKQKHNANDKKLLAAAYIHTKNYGKAQNYLDSLRNENANNQDFYDIHQNLMTYKQQGPAYLQKIKSNPGLKNSLLKLANDRSKESCTHAQALLGLALGMKFQEPFILPQNNGNRLMASESNPLELSENIKLYPNPAQTNLFIDYKVGENIDNQININDVSGRVIKVFTLNANTQLNIMDVNDIPNGIYFVTLLQNKRLISTKKIVIMR